MARRAEKTGINVARRQWLTRSGMVAFAFLIAAILFDWFGIQQQLRDRVEQHFLYDYDLDPTPQIEIIPNQTSQEATLEPTLISEIRSMTTLPSDVLLDAPLINQKPELHNGCEITSLTMLMQYAGFHYDKMELAERMPRDETEIKYNADGTVKYWGNPNLGFVGDVTGAKRGYAIYHQALHRMLLEYIPTAVDLTGSKFVELQRKLAEKKPIVVWTTAHYDAPYKWETWDTSEGLFRGTREEHAVLLVGYDDQYVYVNDPLAYQKQMKVAKTKFLRSWNALGNQALTY